MATGDMTAAILVFALATAVAGLATPVVRILARRLGVVDRPDGFRKVHGRNVPLLGGVAVYAAFLLSTGASYALTGDAATRDCLHSADFWAMAAGAALVLGIGAWDDVRGLRGRWKLLGMLLVAVGMYAAGFRIGAVSNPFGAEFRLGWLALPVTLFWFLGCMNAINLIDGMDGLAAGVVFFASATLFATSLLFGNVPAAILCAALAGAVLGFLFFNFHPASIFLGDSGSLLLGFLLACVGLRGAQKSRMVVALVIPVVALGLPIFDTALAVIRRRLKALPIGCSDRQHIHHKLLEMGLSRRRAVLTLYAACLTLGVVALLTAAARSVLAAGALVALAALTVPVIRVVGRQELRLLRESLGAYADRRRVGVRCRTAAHVATTSMANADSVEGLWEHFAGAAEKLELDEATMTIFGPNGNGRSSFRWRPGDGNGNGNGSGSGHTHSAAEEAAPVLHSSLDARWTAVFPLHTHGTRFGQLHVHKHTNGHALPGELPETLHQLTRALCVHLERVHKNGSGAHSPALEPLH